MIEIILLFSLISLAAWYVGIVLSPGSETEKEMKTKIKMYSAFYLVNLLVLAVYLDVELITKVILLLFFLAIMLITVVIILTCRYFRYLE